MESVSKILISSNGITILLLVFIGIAVFMLLGKVGYFSFKGKNVTIGRTEGEVRATLLKQKEFLLQYCSYLTLMIISDLAKFGVKDVSYVNTDYVVEKVVDEWLGWLLVNHVSNDDAYIKLKTQQSRLIMLKAIGRVNSELLQKEELLNYFEGICEKCTKEIINGVLGVYKIEKK